MARMMNVPVYGFVENYSYFQCPDCGKRVEIFGKSRLDELALQFSLPVLARLCHQLGGGQDGADVGLRHLAFVKQGGDARIDRQALEDRERELQRQLVQPAFAEDIDAFAAVRTLEIAVVLHKAVEDVYKRQPEDLPEAAEHHAAQGCGDLPRHHARDAQPYPCLLYTSS